MFKRTRNIKDILEAFLDSGSECEGLSESDEDDQINDSDYDEISDHESHFSSSDDEPLATIANATRQINNKKVTMLSIVLKEIKHLYTQPILNV